MNPPKANELDYIHFLIAAQKTFTATKAARSTPENPDPPAHDAFTRLLTREPPDTEALWGEAKTLVEPERGIVVVDDTTVDKPYSKKMGLFHRHCSGKHHRVVSGINLSTWSGVRGRRWWPPTSGSRTSPTMASQKRPLPPRW